MLLTFFCCHYIKKSRDYLYKMKHITEAYRYLDNAKEILREKAQKEDRYYKDAKYVKMAGNTAYNGVFVALNGNSFYQQEY